GVAVPPGGAAGLLAGAAGRRRCRPGGGGGDPRRALGRSRDGDRRQLRPLPLPPIRRRPPRRRRDGQADPGPRAPHARGRLRRDRHQRAPSGRQAPGDACRPRGPAKLRRHRRRQGPGGRLRRLCFLRLMHAPARYFHALPDGRVQCDVCPRYCALHDGQRGFCFVRAREGQGMILTTWGRSSGFCVDPIEKKPLNHFLPGTSVLSFGTAGCNLGCRFCQNWDMSKSREMDVLADAASPEEIARRAEELGCRSVAFTYNDPTVFLEYAVDVAQACHARGLKTVSVTAGYICDEPRRELYRHMDAANIDLKGFTQDFYRRVCLGHLDPVLDTLRYLRHETSVWLEIT